MRYVIEPNGIDVRRLALRARLASRPPDDSALASLRWVSQPQIDAAWASFWWSQVYREHNASYERWWGLTLEEQARRRDELQDKYRTRVEAEYDRLYETHEVPDGYLDYLDGYLRQHDQYRRTNLLWRRTWPEWKPDMTLHERMDFDNLLTDEWESRCADAWERAGRSFPDDYREGA